MHFPNIDPVFLRVGPLEFRWYGLMYIIGFVSSYFIVLSGVKGKKLPMTKDNVADLVFTLAVGVILGGRLGYALFYNASYYVAHPLKIFAVWEGGMSFHGGLIGVLVAGIYFVRKNKLGFFELADICAPAAPVGLGLGRLGNFINGELYGRITDVPWGVVFPNGGGVPRHPSQLYEALLEGPILFTVLMLLRRKERPTGTVFWTFIGLYGLFRFCVEFFREPDAQLGLFGGMISMGQILSFPMFLFGMTMAVVVGRKKNP